MSKVVMPDLIRHPVLFRIPAFAGMKGLALIVAGVISPDVFSPFNTMLPGGATAFQPLPFDLINGSQNQSIIEEGAKAAIIRKKRT